MSATSVGGISFELSFDGSKMMSSINSSCRNIRSKFEQSFRNAGQSAAKSISSSNEKIKAILLDTEKTAKSKAASIAAIYRNEGDSAEEAFRKAWSHIERNSTESAGKVKKHFFGIRSAAKKTASGIEKDFGKSFNAVSLLAKKAGIALAAAFGVKKLVDFGKSCIELGSDLQEVQNVVDVTFPRMTAQVDKFAKSAAGSFGLSETMAKRYTGTFGAMAKAFGFSEKAAYDMGSTLTGLAGDVASFYNISQGEAYTKLKSVFTGETESLKELGVVMTQNALDAYAMANGFGKTTQAMSEAEKVALRYSFVQQQLSAASGDFARTSGSWANQVRVLRLQFESLKATIGQGLINLFTPIIKVINTVIGKLITLANAFKAFTELITGKKSSGASTAAPVADLGAVADTAASGLSGASDAASGLSNATKGVGSAAKKAAKEMRALMGFDKVNKLNEPVSESDSGSSGGGTGSAGGGAVGSAMDFGSLAQGETAIDEVDSKFTKMFQNIVNLAKPATDALKNLWNQGLARLGAFAWGSLKDFYERFLVPVGKWTLGKGIPDFVNALNNGLMKVNFDKISSSLRGLWDALAPFAVKVGEGLLWFWKNVLVPLGAWVANEVVPRFLDTLRISIGLLNEILTALQPLFQWFWDNVLQPLAAWTGGVFLQVWDGINTALQSFSSWCAENPGTIQAMTTIVVSFLAAWKLAPIVMQIASFVQAGFNIISMVKSVSGALALLKHGLSVLAGGFNPVVLAIGAFITAGILLWQNWEEVSKFLKRTWENIKRNAVEIFNGIKAFLGKLWEAIKTVASTAWNSIKTFLSTLWSGIRTTAQTVFGGIKTAIGTVWDGIKTKASEIWSGIKETVSGVWNGLKTTAETVFEGIKTTISGVWESVKTKTRTAWEGIKNIIKAPINAILGFVNAFLRGIQTMVNGVANALNTISIDLPGWLQDLTGYTSVGFNVPTWKAPQIPYLAQGAYVKKNAPQLAMIGDNRHQGEFVAPEGKLQAMVDDALRRANPNGITQEELESILNNAVMRIIAALGSIGFNVDGERLATLQRMAQTAIDRRFNTVEIS